MNGDPRPAGLFRRAFAWLVDALMLAVVLLVLALILRWCYYEWLSRQVLDPEGRLFTHYRTVFRAILAAIFALVPFVYFVLLETLPFQATFGKLLFGCRVARSDGARAGVFRVTWRTLMKPASLAPCGMGLLMGGLGPKRTIHDFLSGCAVIRRR